MGEQREIAGGLPASLSSSLYRRQRVGQGYTERYVASGGSQEEVALQKEKMIDRYLQLSAGKVEQMKREQVGCFFMRLCV